jgi:Cu+-exporting ATPase
MSNRQLKIKGMTCAACVRRVERALSRVPGVMEATVNLATERAEVSSEQPVSLEQLIEAVRKAGYEAEPFQSAKAGEMEPFSQAARNRLILSALLTLPVFVLSMLFPNRLPHQGWWLLVLTTPIQFGVALPFYKAAWASLRNGSANMEVLILLGTLSAYFYSLTLTIGTLFGHHHPHVYYETSAVIITLVLFGKYLEARAKGHAQSALKAIWNLLPRTVQRYESGEYRQASLESVQTGDRLLVRSSERMPVDGVVLEGNGWVNESAITGEAVPRECEPGDRVLGGSMLMDGVLHVEATAVGEQTLLVQVAQVVEHAQTQKANIQRLADQIASIFVPVVMAIAFGTFIVWWAKTGSLSGALVPAVSVLVIACPCALGLAVPIAVMTGTTRASKAGILLKGVQSLERVQKLDTLVLDKTGTLTMGQPKVVHIEAFGLEPDRLLQVAASVERYSTHPLAEAIVQEAKARGLEQLSVEEFRTVAGGGVTALVEDAMVEADATGKKPLLPLLIGNARFLQEQGIPVDKGLEFPVLVAIPEHIIGGFLFADEPLPEAKEAVQSLREAGLEPVLCSGDRREAVEPLAKRLGIEQWHAAMLPQQKAALVAELRASGKKVAFVGDGINDAPALARADIGIAIGSGTHLAIETADIVLLNPDLRTLAEALRLARRMNGVIRQNLFFAFVYNVIGIPLAAAGQLDPMIAAAAMSLSSVSVVSNALRLLR